MFVDAYQQYSDKDAFIYRVLEQELHVSYAKLFDDVLILSRALKSKKVEKGSKVIFLCDNRYEWMVTDMALVSLGAIGIPRGSDTPTAELEFIIKHSEGDFIIIENEALYIRHKEMLDTLSLKAIFIMEGEKLHKVFTNLYSYNDILEDKVISLEEIEAFIKQKNSLEESDVFTMIYTSGTTGTPKGVILTHKNIMFNVRELPKLIDLKSDDVWLSILPSWHIFERAAEYISIAKGCCTVYSTIKTFALDLEQYKPTLVATVPRLWESMYTKINSTLEKNDPKKAKIFKLLVRVSASYNKNMRILKDELPRFKDDSAVVSLCKKIVPSFKIFIMYPLNKLAKKRLFAVQEKFGGRLRLAISGGGSLPDFIDSWIDSLGIRIVNAYGMTECAPGIAGRALNCNTFGTLGLGIDDTLIRIVNDHGEEVKAGEVGEIQVRGEQVTLGYYNNKEENKKSFTDDGYLKTGDLGKFTVRKELIITGRSKEVIVLASGENVDPSRIETTISMLPFISDAVLVGQDKKGLGMLIVPDLEKLKEYVALHFDKAIHSVEQVLEDKQIVAKIKGEINELLHHKRGFKPFEKLQNIHFLSEEFKMGEELTNTLKKKRHVIETKYKEVIDKFLH